MGSAGDRKRGSLKVRQSHGHVNREKSVVEGRPVVGKGFVRSHADLDVYKKAFDAAMQIFELSKAFPNAETYSLIDHVRRSPRSICANLAEAWRKRRYKAAFVSKLSDAETEAAEIQVWLQFAVKCEYHDRSKARSL